MHRYLIFAVFLTLLLCAAACNSSSSAPTPKAVQTSYTLKLAFLNGTNKSHLRYIHLRCGAQAPARDRALCQKTTALLGFFRHPRPMTCMCPLITNSITITGMLDGRRVHALMLTPCSTCNQKPIVGRDLDALYNAFGPIRSF